MAFKADRLKEMNLQKIKDYFYREKKANKNSLSESTGISKTTCTTLLKELVEEGFIYQDSDYDSTGGRPSKGYRLNPDYQHNCLIYLKQGEPHQIEIQVRDFAGDRKISLSQKAERSCIEELYNLLDEIFQKDSKITVAAVSLPGVINRQYDVLSCDIWELEGKNLNTLIGKKYGVTVIAENDVNLAAIGYHTREDSLAFLYQPRVGYSGCGIVLNHQLYRGNTLFAGEIGYLSGCAFIEPEDFDTAQNLIVQQLTALICVLNPAEIVICSCYDFDEKMLIESLSDTLISEHLPGLQIVPELENYIFNGLMEAAVDVGRNHLKLREVRRV